MLLVRRGDCKINWHIKPMAEHHVMGRDTDIAGKAVGIEMLKGAEQSRLYFARCQLLAKAKLLLPNPDQGITDLFVLKNPTSRHKPEPSGRAVISIAEQNFPPPFDDNKVDGDQRRHIDHRKKNLLIKHG